MKAVGLRFGVLVLAATLLAPAPARSQAVPGVEDLLERADAVRSSDPAEFNRLLARIEASPAVLNPKQRRHLRLLGAYRDTIAGRYDAAIRGAVSVYEDASEVELKYRAGLLVANVSAITRDFALGLRYLERTLLLEPQITDREVRHVGYGVAAALYNQFDQYELGRTYADKMLSENPSPRNRCAARQFRIEAMYGTGRLVDTDESIRAAIEDCASQKEAIFANLIRRTQAQRWADDGRVGQAVTLLESHLPEVDRTGYTRLIGEIHSLLAKYRLELGDAPGALAAATYVAGLKGQDPRSLPNVAAHHVLYKLALARGDHATALSEYRLYAEADKARLDDIKAREFAFQLSRHELNQKNQSIALLKSENRLLQLRQEVARRTAWNFRLALALLLVLAASLGYWGWRARRTHGSLRTLAETDGLTGLANRRHFRGRSEAALAMCAQRRRPACVLLLDLDHFKQINDQCGHSSGDWVLREVARVGKLHCREHDLFGRIGGEEFAMTLVDCEPDAAMRIAEACRRSIESIDPGAINCALPVAVSIGVVSTSVSGYDYEVLIANADAAMYRSKVAGRNRVTLYEPPPVPPPGQPVMLERRNTDAMLKQY